MKKLHTSGLALLISFFILAPQVGTCAEHSASASKTDVAPAAPLYTVRSVEDLRKAIPALKGLEPATSQQQLSSILYQMAQTIGNLLPRLPDLISREDIYRAERRPGPNPPEQILSLTRPGTGPLDLTTITEQAPRGQEFRYLIACHRSANGAISLQESRTDLKGHPLDRKGKAAAFGSGFAYQWVLFASANQSEFQFRYLGDQELDGHRTYVLAFAQIPGQVRFPAVFQSGGKQAQYFYQGVLWVDQKSFNIIHLRSDIEAPLEKPFLKQLTTDIRFRSVNIPDIDETFWLPGEVQILIDQGRLIIREQHLYSDYHLYHSTARIIPN